MKRGNEMSKHQMNCPICGAEMNFNAEKLDYNITDPELIDPVYGAAIEEAYYCPQCHRTEIRIERA